MNLKVKVTYDNGSKGFVLKKNLHDCPKCKNQSVRGKELFEGGGSTCITPNCTYWFCY